MSKFCLSSWMKKCAFTVMCCLFPAEFSTHVVPFTYAKHTKSANRWKENASFRAALLEPRLSAALPRKGPAMLKTNEVRKCGKYSSRAGNFPHASVAKSSPSSGHRARDSSGNPLSFRPIGDAADASGGGARLHSLWLGGCVIAAA